MKLTLLSDNAIRLEPAGDSLTIESASPDQSFSPFHMMAGALAHCSSVRSVRRGPKTPAANHDLTLEVEWTFADDPYRVDCYDVRFAWPSLPASRLEAAKRVIETCAIHETLQHPPRITVEGTAGDAERRRADGRVGSASA